MQDKLIKLNHNNEDTNNIQQYKIYKRRILIILVYQLCLISTNLMYGAITPIGTELQQIYNLNNYQVILGPQLYLIAYPLFVFPVGKLIEKMGFSIAVYIAIFLNLIGIWLRCLVNTDFSYIIIAYTLLGISKPFFSTSQGKIAMNWLPVMERPIATTILQLLNTFSIASGFLWSGSIFNDYQPEIDALQDFQQGKNMCYDMMYTQAITGTILFIPAILFLREQPPKPPSFGATVTKIPATLQQIGKNKNYLLLLTSYGPLMGIFNSFPVVVSYYIEPYGFDSMDASLLSSIPLFSGPIGILFIGYVMRKYRCYLKLYRICILACLICMILFPFTLNTKEIGIVLIGSIINGIFLSPIVPIIIEFSIELTFPLQESLIIGLIFSSSLVFGFLITFAVSSICQGESVSQTIWTTVLMSCICLFCLIQSLFIKQDLRRWKAEISQSLNHIDQGDQLESRQELNNNSQFFTDKKEQKSQKIDHQTKDNIDNIQNEQLNKALLKEKSIDNEDL